ncbi:MAG: hypothetical protein ACKOET_03035 [Verrucomicrobiota bacterium]
MESLGEPRQRGEVLFRDGTDRRRILGLVSELPERSSLEVHAFVLMSNHYQAWKDLVRATEQLLGRSWSEMTTQYGDWDRNGLMAVATRHLGWRLVEVVREIPGLGYTAAAQGIRRFWSQLPKDPRKERFRRGLLAQLSKVKI